VFRLGNQSVRGGRGGHIPKCGTSVRVRDTLYTCMYTFYIRGLGELAIYKRSPPAAMG